MLASPRAPPALALHGRPVRLGRAQLASSTSLTGTTPRRSVPVAPPRRRPLPRCTLECVHARGLLLPSNVPTAALVVAACTAIGGGVGLTCTTSEDSQVSSCKKGYLKTDGAADICVAATCPAGSTGTVPGTSGDGDTSGCRKSPGFSGTVNAVKEAVDARGYTTALITCFDFFSTAPQSGVASCTTCTGSQRDHCSAGVCKPGYYNFKAGGAADGADTLCESECI